MLRKKLPTKRSKRKRCEKGGEEPGEGSSVTPDSIALTYTALAQESIPPDSTALAVTLIDSGTVKSTAIVKYNGDAVPLNDFDPGENVSGDDCEVIGDEDCDGVWYEAAGDDEGYLEDVNQGNPVIEEEGGNRVGVEEEFCQDFEAEFGEGAREQNDETIITNKSLKQEPRTLLFGQGQTWEGSQASQGGHSHSQKEVHNHSHKDVHSHLHIQQHKEDNSHLHIPQHRRDQQEIEGKLHSGNPLKHHIVKKE